MTVRVTTVSGGGGTGSAVGLYYGQMVERVMDVEDAGIGRGVGESVGGYYESASGAFWMGAGAERLGLDGVPGRRDIASLVDGYDSDGVLLGRKFGETSARAFDVTFSVQKEVSILWAAADGPTREVIEQAVVDAAVAVLDDQVGVRAATRMRTGPNGDFLAADKKPVMVGAEGPAVAIIPEFTSRKGDPQLHVHALVSSKVWEPTTERWLALEARELKQDQRALSGLFHAGLETGLSKQLGVTWGAREYRYARTITGISDSLVDVFSQRRADVDTRLATKLERFETELGHAPTPQQRWKLEREAAVDSRPTKSAETLDFAGWRATIESHTGIASEMLVASVTGATERSHTISQRTVDDMITATIGELTDTKSSWTRGDFKAELTRVLPPGLAITPAQLVKFVNTQTDLALNELVRVSPATVDRPNMRWTTPDVLTQETRILDHIEQATRVEVPANTGVTAHAPEWMDELQIQAAGRVASASDFEVVVGLAGAGKTSMLSTAVGALYADGRDVFGLAPSATAAEVLGTEIDVATENVSKFLWEHMSRDGGPSPEFRLEPGATLIIDEAGMVSTPQWDQLTTLAASNNWRMVAVGDGYQFSAVGRGGIFDHLTNTLPSHRISRLEQVHRFDNPWEAQASAQLRQGNTTALDLYEQHGRIIPTGPDRTLVDTVTGLYLDRINTGIEVGIFASTNSQVAELNTAIQKALAETGQLGKQITATSTAAGGGVLFVGDLIETRSNNRGLETDRGQFVKNRDRWTITDSTPNGGLTVTGRSGTVTLPSDYVTEHVNLAYAQTSHASQGRTIEGTSIVAYDPNTAPIDRAGLYVPLTRGKQENLVVVTADTGPIAKAHLADAIGRRWIDIPAIAHLQPADQVPLAKQIDTAKEALEHFEQQTLFTRSAPEPKTKPQPAPTLEPSPGEGIEFEGRAIRSGAEERQHPTREPETSVVEPVVVLSPGDLAAHLETVDRLGWGVENSFDNINRIDLEKVETRSYGEQVVTQRDQLKEQRVVHVENKPLIRGVKAWQSRLDQIDRNLGGFNNQITDINTRLEQLDHERKSWTPYRSLTSQIRYNSAQQALTKDRAAHAQNAIDDPTIISRLGPAPTQAEPEAHQAWLDAAGAISHQQIFNKHRAHIQPGTDRDLYPISRSLDIQTKTAIKTLGQHIDPTHIPELQQQRQIQRRGPELSL